LSFRMGGFDNMTSRMGGFETNKDLLKKNGKIAMGIGQTPLLSMEPDVRELIQEYVAALDWFLNVMSYNGKKGRLRFGTIITMFQSMTAFRVFAFGESLGTPEHSIFEYVTMHGVRLEMKSMCKVPPEACYRTSLYPYISSLKKVAKNDMSATAKPDLHNFVNCVGALVGKNRGKNSKFIQEGSIEFLMSAGFCSYYLFNTVQKTKQHRKVSGKSQSQLQYIDAVRDDFKQVKKFLAMKARTMRQTREDSIGRYIADNANFGDNSVGGDTIGPDDEEGDEDEDAEDDTDSDEDRDSDDNQGGSQRTQRRSPGGNTRSPGKRPRLEEDEPSDDDMDEDEEDESVVDAVASGSRTKGSSAKSAKPTSRRVRSELESDDEDMVNMPNA